MAKKKKKDDKKALEHELIPKHEKLSDKKAKEVKEKFQVSANEMPKISITDPAIAHMDVEEGDVIEIQRSSPTAGQTNFYRCVVRE